jgi:hypothetical protein
MSEKALLKQLASSTKFSYHKVIAVNNNSQIFLSKTFLYLQDYVADKKTGFSGCETEKSVPKIYFRSSSSFST